MELTGANQGPENSPDVNIERLLESHKDISIWLDPSGVPVFFRIKPNGSYLEVKTDTYNPDKDRPEIGLRLGVREYDPRVADEDEYYDPCHESYTIARNKNGQLDFTPEEYDYAVYSTMTDEIIKLVQEGTEIAAVFINLSDPDKYSKYWQRILATEFPPNSDSIEFLKKEKNNPKSLAAVVLALSGKTIDDAISELKLQDQLRELGVTDGKTDPYPQEKVGEIYRFVKSLMGSEITVQRGKSPAERLKGKLESDVDRRRKSMEFKLRMHRFQIRDFYAEYSAFRHSVIIKRADNSHLEIKREDIPKILSGEIELDSADRKEFDEWYERSNYKYYTELEDLDRRLKEAVEPEEMIQIEQRAQELLAEDPEERLNIQLAYLYSEDNPERINLLRDILYGA